MDHIVTHLIQIYGKVQGVGFRHFVYIQTSRRLVTGWIRNRSDGSVEALLQGKKIPDISLDIRDLSLPPPSN